MANGEVHTEAYMTHPSNVEFLVPIVADPKDGLGRRHIGSAVMSLNLNDRGVFHGNSKWGTWRLDFGSFSVKAYGQNPHPPEADVQLYAEEAYGNYLASIITSDD